MELPRVGIFAFVVLTGMIVTGCASNAFPTTRYTKYNVHVRNDMSRSQHRLISRASYTGWVASDFILPPNTPVQVGYYDRGFTLQRLDDPQVILYELKPGAMGMSEDNYIRLVTSSEPVDLSGLSDIDKQGVKEGKALLGMSRDGVMVALGYPSRHKTPSLQSKVWTYWKNRMVRTQVSFNAEGFVERVR